MAAACVQQADVFRAPSTSKQLNMNYYLSEGLEDVERLEYRDVRSLKNAVDSQVEALRSTYKADDSKYLTPYLVFFPVSARQLENIDRIRKHNYKTLRFLYFNEPRTLIVKNMPGPFHEMVAREFIYALRDKIRAEGCQREVTCMGSTTYQGTGSRKEADASLRPLRARPDPNDWPTVILECGVSETPRRLAADARWWFDHSNGAVKIVFLFFVSTENKTVRIELWELTTLENPHVTRGNNAHGGAIPIPKAVVTLSSNEIAGYPLKIRFKDVLLRAPMARRGERDFSLDEDDLREYYDHIWPEWTEVDSESEYTGREEGEGPPDSDLSAMEMEVTD